MVVHWIEEIERFFEKEYSGMHFLSVKDRFSQGRPVYISIYTSLIPPSRLKNRKIIVHFVIRHMIRK